MIRLLLVLAPSFAGTLTVGSGGDYAAIQDAIDAASDGDTVQVAAGTYAECIDLGGRDLDIVGVSGGQGGTLANLRGYIEGRGGRVLAATALTGKAHSAVLTLTPAQCNNLRSKHGPELEAWWKVRFGYAFDCLTESEARTLSRAPDAHAIRDRIAAEE